MWERDKRPPLYMPISEENLRLGRRAGSALRWISSRSFDPVRAMRCAPRGDWRQPQHLLPMVTSIDEVDEALRLIRTRRARGRGDDIGCA